jgi:hypothetical protein
MEWFSSLPSGHQEGVLWIVFIFGVIILVGTPVFILELTKILKGR